MRNGNTKKIKRIGEKTLLVIVDMGKTTHTGYLRFPDGAEVKPFEFSKSRKGYEEFGWRICQAQRQLSIGEVVVGFESTGP
jgi:hypothetical protein